ncbi:kelch domain-containing protein 1 [Phytophthora boehmeriae]|uniref:Kelch domain-containing protein 1 n=1 Tax=Phytophthora boehmeriae TaxID=109152 RepID=A0A8T1WZA0_9STRA|nr:kelch domain-containing protein 1 [Phytophthora boehmeriae]
MTLLSYEGKARMLLLPNLTGVQFAFTAGSLTIHCSNFTGDIVLTKPEQPLSSTQQSNLSLSVAATPSSSAKKRTIDLSASDDDEDEVDAKRLRPNFLSDAEQATLLAQMDKEGESQQSKPKSKKAKTETVTPLDDASAANEPVDTAATGGKSTKKPLAKRSKKTTSSAKETGDSFFSPEPKQSASRKKTPDSQKKHGRKPKRSEPLPAKSIKDMMSGPPKPKETAIAQWKVVETEGNVPPERWGHTATKISNNRMVVYGGTDDDENTLGDLHVFDLKTHRWTTPLNCETILRTWHDVVYLASKNLLIVFGGERNSAAEGELDLLSDIMVLDTECMLWYPPAIRGTAPSARSGHTCSVLGNDMVVFGGSRGRNRQSSVHVLDCDDWNWKVVKVEGKAPSARTYHSAVAVGNDKIVYFGGNDSTKSFSSIHVLHKVEKDEGDAVWKWEEPAVVGVPPQARTGHSSTLLQTGKILIFGGWDPQRDDASSPGSVFDDAFLLDTQTWEWEPAIFAEASSTEGALRGRVGHSAVLDDNGFVHLFGGQNGSDNRLKDVGTIAVTVKPGEFKEPEDEAQTIAAGSAMVHTLETESI